MNKYHEPFKETVRTPTALSGPEHCKTQQLAPFYNKYFIIQCYKQLLSITLQVLFHITYYITYLEAKEVKE